MIIKGNITLITSLSRIDILPRINAWDSRLTVSLHKLNINDVLA